MVKKILMLTAGVMMFFIASANPVVDNEPNGAPAQEQTFPDGQVVMDPQTVPSEEVSTVQESQLAHKMTQAEKNRNAKENDSWGGAITIIAMTIVIAALIVLSILFYFFGKISSRVLSKKKKIAKGLLADHDNVEDHEVDSGETIAAIAMALSEHFNQQHDMEDTILTIRKLKRTYSPWNSKIYNLREMPSVAHNPGSHSAFKH